MARWQYPALVEPVTSGPETVTVDRWQGTCPQPVRRRAGAPESCLVEPLLVTVAATVALDWLGEQPDQALGRRRIAPESVLVEPIVVAAPATVYLDWAGIQPSQVVRLRRAGGECFTEPFPEVPTVDRWQTRSVDVVRRRRDDPSSVLVEPFPIAPSLDQWMGSAGWQPGRARRAQESAAFGPLFVPAVVYDPADMEWLARWPASLVLRKPFAAPSVFFTDQDLTAILNPPPTKPTGSGRAVQPVGSGRSVLVRGSGRER